MMTVNCHGMEVRSKLDEALGALHRACVCATGARALLVAGDGGDEAPGAVAEALRQAELAGRALALALAGGGATGEAGR